MRGWEYVNCNEVLDGKSDDCCEQSIVLDQLLKGVDGIRS